jgi:uncharacterized membrane protein YraQ (UPF0718 family)
MLFANTANSFFASFQQAILIYISIVYEALPFILLGAVVAGMLEEFLPPKLLVRMLPRSRFVGILWGGCLGIIFPMCECGIVPIMRRLLRKGLPLSTSTAYLLAGPVINPVVLASTYVAFSGMEETLDSGGRLAYQMGGPAMTIARGLLAYLVAVSVSMAVEFFVLNQGIGNLVKASAMPSRDAEEREQVRDLAPAARIWRITGTILHDFVDITTFLVIGAGLAATIRFFVTHDMISAWTDSNIIFAILLMMALAILLCLCSEADAFVAASMVKMAPAAKLAFLVLGPMCDLKLMALYTRVFKPRLIVFIFGLVIVLSFAGSVGVHYLWARIAPMIMVESNPATQQPQAR